MMVVNEKGYWMNLLKNIGEKKHSWTAIFFYDMRYVSQILTEASS